MSDNQRLGLARKLVAALEQDDQQMAEQLLDRLTESQQMQLFEEIGRLTRQLHDNLSMFAMDSRLATLTEQELPDARERLNYVISMTEQAAHQTLAAVEKLLPIIQEWRLQTKQMGEKCAQLIEQTMPEVEVVKNLLGELQQHFEGSEVISVDLQNGLTEILMAQSYQDVTGQIIGKVISCVHEMEESMVNFIREKGFKSSAYAAMSNSTGALPGPVVPGVDDKLNDNASNQDEVDALLLSLGF